MAVEIWKPIKGYEGLYEISNFGRVKSLPKYHYTTEKILKCHANSKGYMRVQLTRNGVKERLFVHRLVAKAFIDNPDGLDVVNHKDFNPQNNVAENLEWTTFLDNIRYSARHGRFNHTKEWKEKIIESQRKPVIRTDILTGEELTYPAINSTADDGFCPSRVCLCCNGKGKKHKGYLWRFQND